MRREPNTCWLLGSIVASTTVQSLAARCGLAPLYRSSQQQGSAVRGRCPRGASLCVSWCDNYISIPYIRTEKDRSKLVLRVPIRKIGLREEIVKGFQSLLHESLCHAPTLPGKQPLAVWSENFFNAPLGHYLRSKFSRHYQGVYAENPEYSKT